MNSRIAPWAKILSGDSKAGVAALQSKHQEDARNPSDAINLCIAYLWQRDWDKAWRHISDFAAGYPYRIDVAFLFAGTARWCSGDFVAAIEEWRAGLECDYTDGAGGVSIPMHLTFAATLEPKAISLDEAAALLRDRVIDTPQSTTPAELAYLLLGELDASSAMTAGANSVSHLRGSELSAAMQRHRFAVVFWNGVRALMDGDDKRFIEAMMSVSALSASDFDKDDDLFLQRLWGTEFFLARYEAARHA